MEVNFVFYLCILVSLVFFTIGLLIGLYWDKEKNKLEEENKTLRKSLTIYKNNYNILHKLYRKERRES